MLNYGYGINYSLPNLNDFNMSLQKDLNDPVVFPYVARRWGNRTDY